MTNNSTFKRGHRPDEMEISAAQSIKIFGMWDQPRVILLWDDVKAQCLTWRRLRADYAFSAAQLKTLQPDRSEWINRGALTLYEMLDMTVFPVNPLVDMRADLAEMWSMRWTPDQLSSMHVTYDQMRVRGLTPSLMKHFNYPLSGWMTLGFQHSHCEALVDEAVLLVFGMPKAELRTILLEVGAGSGI